MDKDEFRQWIYDNYNVPGDNCTLAPAMLCCPQIPAYQPVPPLPCDFCRREDTMNVVILTGRLTAEPELRYTQQNVPCTSFNLAVDRASKGDDADFPTIIAWRETAEFACKYLYKGIPIPLLILSEALASCRPLQQ